MRPTSIAPATPVTDAADGDRHHLDDVAPRRPAGSILANASHTSEYIRRSGIGARGGDRLPPALPVLEEGNCRSVRFAGRGKTNRELKTPPNSSISACPPYPHQELGTSCGGRFTFPQGQNRIAAVAFDLVSRRALGVGQLPSVHWISLWRKHDERPTGYHDSCCVDATPA